MSRIWRALDDLYVIWQLAQERASFIGLGAGNSETAISMNGNTVQRLGDHLLN